VGPNDPDQNNVGVAVDAQQAADQAAEMVVVDEHSGTPVAGVAGGPDVVDQLDTDPAGGGGRAQAGHRVRALKSGQRMAGGTSAGSRTSESIKPTFQATCAVMFWSGS
jgi:hypothetical protein